MEKELQNSLFREMNGTLIRITRMHHKLCERQTDVFGIHHGQHMLLMRLSRTEVIPSQKELAARMEISPAAVAVSLKKLETDGYIARRAGRDDTRQNRIRITEKGARVVAGSREKFGEVDRQMFRGISEEELKACYATLAKIENNLKEDLLPAEEGEQKNI